MSETEEIAHLVLKADKNVPAAHMTMADGREFIITRNDLKVDQITAPNAAEVLKPKIVTQAVQLQTVESFIEYTNRFQNSDSVVFADMVTNTILGVVDYHQQPELLKFKDDAVSEARQRDPKAELAKHTVTLKLPHSLEWSTWMGSNNKLMSHKDFATFLEHNSIDVMPLARRSGLATSEDDGDMPETLLELTRSLQVVQNVNFNSSVRYGSYDKIDFAKESDATARGSIGLPLSFTINIPVYFGESPVQLTCFIRKEINDGSLKIGYSISRAENVRQEEFMRIVGVVAGATELTTLFGKPA